MASANWSNPTLTSSYTNFVTEVKNRDEDLALQFDGTTSTNIPTNTIRWDSSAGRWKKWTGSAWGELAATYALTNITATGTLYTGSSIQIGTNGGTQGVFVGQAGYSGALLYRADGSVQLSARSGYGLTFAPAPDSGTTWGQFSAGGFFGLGITPTTKLHATGTQVTDTGLSATVGPVFSCNTTNNADTTGVQTAFTIGRDGKAGVSYGNYVNFNLGRYSQSGTASQTQLTLRLTNGNQNNPEVDVLSLFGNGVVRVNNGLFELGNSTAGVSVSCLFANPANNWSLRTGTTANTFSLVDNQFSATRIFVDNSGNAGFNTTTPRGNLSIANNTTGTIVSTSLHLGYSTSDFYGFRLVNTNNPSSTAAGTFTLQRGTTAAWADVLSVDNGGLITANSGLVGTFGLSTAASTSSVSSVTYSSIPSWVKCIKLMFSGVSLTNTDNMLVRLSYGGTFVIAGYTSSSILIGAPSDGSVGALTGGKYSVTNGFGIYSNNAANALTGILTLQNITGNTWIINGSLQVDTALNNVITVNGSVALSGTCDGIRLLSSSTGTFDAGSINIAYEG